MIEIGVIVGILATTFFLASTAIYKVKTSNCRISDTKGRMFSLRFLRKNKSTSTD